MGLQEHENLQKLTHANFFLSSPPQLSWLAHHHTALMAIEVQCNKHYMHVNYIVDGLAQKYMHEHYKCMCDGESKALWYIIELIYTNPYIWLLS